MASSPQPKRHFNLHFPSFFKEHSQLADPNPSTARKPARKASPPPKSHHSLLYRLFHPDAEGHSPKQRPTGGILVDDSDDELKLPPPALVDPSLQSIPIPKEEILSTPSTPSSSGKSHVNLFEFFRHHEPSFIFSHLKPHQNKHAPPSDAKQNSHKSSSTTLVEPDMKRNVSDLSLCDKYGWIEKKCVGKGANGIVRISHKPDEVSGCEKLYAIKVRIASLFSLKTDSVNRNLGKRAKKKAINRLLRRLQANSALVARCITKT
jgi:hypothetical protein